MTDRQSVSDAIATVDRRTYEIQYRVRHGILDPHETADRLQQIIENGEPKKQEPPLLTPLYTTTLEAVGEHKTSDCFKSNRDVRYWRGGDLDRWTPQERKAHSGGECLVSALASPATLRQIAADILGVDVEVGDAELQRLLIKGGHCVEMRQIESQIERSEAGEKNTGFEKDGRWTFSFVRNYDGTEENDYEDETVSVVHGYWDRRHAEWNVGVDRFGCGFRWGPGSRAFSRNEDSGTL